MPQSSTISHAVGTLALLVALALAVLWGSRGWELTGLSGHEFRQAQTALTIQAMEKDGFRLDYATPVLGKPWSIPMEFPLYQFLVVEWRNLTGQGIAQSGRSVAAACFLLGLPALFLLLRMGGFSVGGSCLALVLVVCSPVYLFYSRTVMIESLAWACSAWFLWALVKFREAGAYRFLPIALLVGGAAVLVKATTWAAFCLPWAILFGADVYRQSWRDRKILRRMLVESIGVGVPLLVLGFLWVAKADAIKAENPIAHFLISKELQGFNFGSWAMRFDSAEWKVLLSGWGDAVMPWPAIGVGFLLALSNAKSRRILLLSGGAFLGIQLIFFNLYLLHDYYFYANGAFLSLVVGTGAAAYWDRSESWLKGRIPVLLIVVMMAGGQFARHNATLYSVQTAYATGDYGLTKAIRLITEEEEVIVTHSTDWNSALAYFSARRMLMIPDSQMFYHPEKVRENIAILADESVPLLLMMGEARGQAEWIVERIEQLELWPQPVFEWGGHVTAYARADRYTAMRTRLEADTPLGIVLDRSADLLPVESRMQIAGTDLESQISGLNFVPEFGVLPFGISINSTQYGHGLLLHATSELYFEIPPLASSVEVGYFVSSASFSQRDFDGMSFHMEMMLPTGEILPLALDWVSPQSELGERKRTIPLTAVPPNSKLLIRALPGPHQSNAFDQGWLHRVAFSAED